MVFSTILFLCVFLPITIAIYYLMPGRAKNVWLLFASILFYAWGEPKFVFVMLLSILCNYGFGMWLERAKRGKPIVASAVIVNLGILFVFKYFTFVMDTIKTAVHGEFDVIQIALPIGISFYTFQGMSYVIDVYRGGKSADADGDNRHVAQHNLLHLALYIAMFPQLIAGPIVRYHDIADSLASREHSADQFLYGMWRFSTGLAKKAVLANMTGALAASIMEGDIHTLGIASAWLGALAYTLQIYFDFSGYSDMAIGLGQIFGFHFLENFNYPYIATSITDFWRRWHMSLSGWFRDYLYIPLGGSRRGNVYLNLFIVFLATGIWHGAAWGFVFWGVYHGVFRLLEKAVASAKKGKTSENKNKPMLIMTKCAGWIYTTLVVMIGWVFFAQVEFQKGLQYVAVMFGIRRSTFVGFDVRYYLSHQMCFYLTLAILACIPWKQVFSKVFDRIEKVRGVWLVKACVSMMLLVISFIYILNSSFNPFIYFRF